MPFANVIGHEGPKRKLRTALANETIGHAYLFVGEEGVGKRLMALRFAQALCCESPPATGQPDSCGQCRACVQIGSESYPDFLMIQPEEDKANPQIKIDQVREVERHMMYRPLFSSRKICVINDAERLTPSAANAFLKTLEDPPEHCLFILVTSHPMKLLATVRSRCLTLRFFPASSSQVEGALALKQALPEDDAKFLSQVSGNRIGVALQADAAQVREYYLQFFELCRDQSMASTTDVLNLAEQCSKAGPSSEMVVWLTYGLRDLLLASIGAPESLLLHHAQRDRIQQLVNGIATDQLFDLCESLHTLEQAPNRNLNPQLVLENFLIRFQQVIHRHAA
jgi:DNA polymerase III subunit delta'